MQGNINIPDSKITTNLSFRKLVLMNMKQLTNFPYIEKDFDALTDYELLCLVVKYLNDVIANQNEQNNSITRMYQSFLALQDYVNNTKDELEDAFNNLDDYVSNYFANLDVQDEINNKLDEMLEDGVLEQIIEQFINSTALWVYDTVNDMKQATNLIDGSYAKTLGYYSVNDGGGSTYKITDTVDNTIHQETLTNNLYASLIYDSEYIKPEQIGAYGNGINDDTTAIQECLTKYKNTIFTKIYKVTSQLTIQNGTKLVGNGTIETYIDGYLFSNMLDCTIRDLTFINRNTNLDNDELPLGKFTYSFRRSIIDGCFLNGYQYFADSVTYVSRIINNVFFLFNKYFLIDVTDSIIDNNYINATSYAIERSYIIRSSFSNSTFSNNWCDYWLHGFRLRAGNITSRIIGNHFDDMVSVFQDYVSGLDIIGNSFTNIKYKADNWSVTPPQEIIDKNWGIFCFDDTTTVYESSNHTLAMQYTNFIGNSARNCSYYLYAAPTGLIYMQGQCNFMNNDMHQCENGENFHYIYTASSDFDFPKFDFWEGKTFTTLPNARIGSGSRLFTYDKMECYLDTSGTITKHVNINGTWKEYVFN